MPNAPSLCTPLSPASTELCLPLLCPAQAPGSPPPGLAHTALGCQPAPSAWGHSMPAPTALLPLHYTLSQRGAPGGQGVTRRQAKWTGLRRAAGDVIGLTSLFLTEGATNRPTLTACHVGSSAQKLQPYTPRGPPIYSQQMVGGGLDRWETDTQESWG